MLDRPSGDHRFDALELGVDEARVAHHKVGRTRCPQELDEIVGEVAAGIEGAMPENPSLEEMPRVLRPRPKPVDMAEMTSAFCTATPRAMTVPGVSKGLRTQGFASPYRAEMALRIAPRTPGRTWTCWWPSMKSGRRPSPAAKASIWRSAWPRFRRCRAFP